MSEPPDLPERPVLAQASLADLARQGDIYTVLLEHARRGLRIQLLLRWVLIVFLALVITAQPPRGWGGCAALVVGYAVGAAVFALVTRRQLEAAARFAWLALLVDVFVVGTVAVLAGRSPQTWTADIIVNGLFLVPLLAATQLRPFICAAVAVPAVVVYFFAAAAARLTHLEPWSSVLLRTFALAGLSVGCILLSRVQRSRVVDIAALATERSHLLAEAMHIEERERRDLAEHLHDGVLQYLLAARQDLQEAQTTSDQASIQRVDDALQRSTVLLRSTMSELHPAVLEQAGLPTALAGLLRTTAARGRLTAELHTTHWGSHVRTDADPVLFSAARELLANVVKHADASQVDVTLEHLDDTVRLTVDDDGTGIASESPAERLAQGHIGLASQRARVESLGGRLTVSPGHTKGTTAIVEVPVMSRTPHDQPRTL